jgi:HD-GYP domain-containing protein (c-di-GMP phosphodiesterase class II)
LSAILHVIEGPDRGRMFHLGLSMLTIGRNAENTIVLNDTAVSGVHTKIARSVKGQFTLHDNGSTNGSFVNGCEQQVAELQDGDRIRIGETTFAFEERRSSGILPGLDEDQGAVVADTAGLGSFRSVLESVDAREVERSELEVVYRRALITERLDRVLAELHGAAEILTAVLDAGLAVTGALRGFVLLLDERSGELFPSVARDVTMDTTDGDAPVTFSKSVALGVVSSGRSQLHAGNDERGPILCVPITTLSRTTGVVYLSDPVGGSFQPEDQKILESLGHRAGVCVAAAGSKGDFEVLFASMIDAIMRSIQAKDVYTRGHSERVRHYSKLLAKELLLDPEDVKRVNLGAALHDIGKIGMPDSVLKFNKNPRLSPEQLAEVKKHPSHGARILGDISFLSDIVPAAELHHEDWDGGGYPFGMAGEEVPLIARIVAVADTYDAITTDRPYQKGRSYEEGHEILRKIAGKRLEPALVEAFISAFRRYRKAPPRPALPRIDATSTERVSLKTVQAIREAVEKAESAATGEPEAEVIATPDEGPPPEPGTEDLPDSDLPDSDLPDSHLPDHGLDDGLNQAITVG